MEKRNQIVITKIENRLFALYLQGDTIIDCVCEPKEDEVSVGDVFVGRIDHIVKNIRAAFVKVTDTEMAYLPLTPTQMKELKTNDEILVQVSKAAVKTKQAVLTTKIELTGQYCVVGFGHGPHGISKKILEDELRRKLKSNLANYQDFSYHIVLRTSAQEVPWSSVEEEIQTLAAELDNIKEKSKYRKAPARLGNKKEFYEKFIQQYSESEYERILTDECDVYEKLVGYVSNVEQYEDESFSLNSLYGLKKQLQKALTRCIWLKSGGNIIIEPTEALTVIDVNTGKAIDGKRAKETTFYKINVEAAVEAARQIRLRNISGIILIDFIELQDKENLKNLLTILKNELAKDKIPCKFVDMTALGLAEITRMKKNVPLADYIKKVDFSLDKGLTKKND